MATYKWLEWFVPKKKKLFGFKYGFQFEEGKIYRILAREYINKPTDKFIRYYVDDVLEYDIKDNRFDPVYLFESKFDDEVLDLVVLIKSKICGWSRDNFYRMPSATMIAFLDLKTNEVNRHPTFLRWIEKIQIQSYVIILRIWGFIIFRQEKVIPVKMHTCLLMW